MNVLLTVHPQSNVYKTSVIAIGSGHALPVSVRVRNRVSVSFSLIFKLRSGKECTVLLIVRPVLN